MPSKLRHFFEDLQNKLTANTKNNACCIQATTAIQVTGGLEGYVGNNENTFKNVIPERGKTTDMTTMINCPVKIVTVFDISVLKNTTTTSEQSI